ncbi:MAG TPA: nucleotidyltransferase domain-containing protein [Patescibacteria group bacterium]|nr:nucleotidyltransferase domain-containing protein [Patescibacteria group bacterium]
MAYSKREINQITGQFIKELKRDFKVDKVILFGSYAYGRPQRRSDIDIAVISPDFTHLNDYERIKLLLAVAHRIKTREPIDFETLGYSPSEYQKAGYYDIPLGEIKEKGKIVYSA